mgnify:CR=1 FL=1
MFIGRLLQVHFNFRGDEGHGRFDLGDDTWGLSMAAHHVLPKRQVHHGLFWCLQLLCTKHLSNSITLVDSQVMVNNSSIGKIKGIYGVFSLLARVDNRDMLTRITTKICKDMYSLGPQEFVYRLRMGLVGKG